MLIRTWFMASVLGTPIFAIEPASAPPAQTPIYFPPPPPLPELKTAREYVERGDARFAAGRAQGDPTPDFEAALRLDPKCARAHVGRGLCFVRKIDLDRALQDFDIAVKLDPKDPRTWTCRGNLLLRLGKHKEALRDFDKAIQLDPCHVDAYQGRGCLWLDPEPSLRDPSKAVMDFQQACKLTDWKNWEYLYLLTLAYADNGEFAEAIRWQREIEKDFAQRREPIPVFLQGQVYHFERQWERKRSEKLGPLLYVVDPCHRVFTSMSNLTRRR